MYPTDIMEYEYTNHMWVICSMYMCSIYPMYINENYFVFPFVYLKDNMEYEYTNHTSIHMFHVHVLYQSHVHKRNTQVWCERLVFVWW